MSDFERARKGRPCPVCGRTKGCSVRRADGAVFCVSSDGAAQGPSVLGSNGRTYTRGNPFASPAGNGLVWRDAEAPEAKRFERTEKDQEAEQHQRLVRTRSARQVWHAAKGGAGHDRIVAYLQARTGDAEIVSRLPLGRLPPTLRYMPWCLDVAVGSSKDRAAGEARIREFLEERGVHLPTLRGRHEIDGVRYSFGGGENGLLLRVESPAIVCQVRAPDRPANGAELTTGVWRVFLDPGGAPRKREGDEARKGLGDCFNGGAIWLSRQCERGVLLVAEGMETAIACEAATGLAAWSAMSRIGLTRLALPWEMAGGPSRLRAVVVCGDVDASGDGQRDAAEAVRRLDRMYGELGLRAVLALPTPELYPQLYEAGKPRQGKSVDWEDVYRLLGREEARRGIVAALAGAGVDLNEPGGTSEPEGRATTSLGAAAGGGGGGRGSLGVPAWDEAPILAGGYVEWARRFLVERHLLEGSTRFGLVRWAGKWFQWVGRRYREVPDERMAAIVQNWLSQFRVRKREELVMLDPAKRDVAEVLSALAIDCTAEVQRMPSYLPASVREGAIAWGAAERFEEEESIGRGDDPTDFVSFANGRLDLGALVRHVREAGMGRAISVSLTPHTPEVLTTTCMPYALPIRGLESLIGGADPDAVYREHCPVFYQALADYSDGDAEWEAQLQEMMGVTLSLKRVLELIFTLQGPQGSGKGTIFEALIAMKGHQNLAVARISELAKDRFALASLVGADTVIMPDAHAGDYQAGSGFVELAKSLSGNDPLSFRDLYTRTTGFYRFNCQLWMAFNDLPELRDSSGAFAGRFVILPMVRSFGSRTGADSSSVDTRVKQAVKREAAGIALWALMGYLRLFVPERPRLTLCAASKAMMRGFVNTSAPIAQFLDDCCVVNQKASVAFSDLYAVHERWCDWQGYECVGRNKFGNRLRPHVPTLLIRDRERPVMIDGIGLKPLYDLTSLFDGKAVELPRRPLP